MPFKILFPGVHYNCIVQTGMMCNIVSWNISVSDDNTSDMVTMHRSTAHEENVSMSIIMIHKLKTSSVGNCVCTCNTLHRMSTTSSYTTHWWLHTAAGRLQSMKAIIRILGWRQVQNLQGLSRKVLPFNSNGSSSLPPPYWLISRPSANHFQYHMEGESGNSCWVVLFR